MEKEIRKYENKLEIRQDDNEEYPTVSGYALVFNKQTDMGYFIEEIDSKSLDGADMSDVVALFNHDENMPLARTGSVNNLILTIDNVGLRYEFKAMNDDGEKVAENIKLGIIRGSSFAFVTKSAEWTDNIDNNGKSLRKITAIEKVYDVSPVINPAYSDTSVFARCMPKKSEVIKRKSKIDYKIENLKNKNENK